MSCLFKKQNYDKIAPMKLNILLSILFAIVTSFAAIHEVEHIEHNDSSSCLVCTVNNNLVSADAVLHVADIDIFCFEEVIQNSDFLYLHVSIDSNKSRAPPKIS